jgi:hypothetical protein
MNELAVKSLVEWLENTIDEHHVYFANFIKGISLEDVRELLAALSNAEFKTDNETLMNSVCFFLYSKDKRLTQTAASFLLTCGGDLGRDFLFQELATERVPHIELIEGLIDLIL